MNICEICQKEFIPSRNTTGKFCSKRCWYVAPKNRPKNPEKIAGTRHLWRRLRRIKYTEFVNRLKTRPCMDCNSQFNPWCMHFDHRPNENKKFNVASLVGAGCISLNNLKKEIAKCDIVCANCHANRTYKRLKEKQNGYIS